MFREEPHVENLKVNLLLRSFGVMSVKCCFLGSIFNPKFLPGLEFARTWDVDLPMDIFARLMAESTDDYLDLLISAIRFAASYADPCSLTHVIRGLTIDEKHLYRVQTALLLHGCRFSTEWDG